MMESALPSEDLTAKDKMKKGEAIIMEYIDGRLHEENPTLISTLTTLCSLGELLDKDMSIRISAARSRLPATICGLLNTPCGYFDMVKKDDNGTIEKRFNEGATKAEKEFKEPSFTEHPLLYTLSLKCLYSLCTLPISHHSKFVDPNLIHTLVGYLSLHPVSKDRSFNHFYQFDSNYFSAMTKLLQGGQTVQVKIGEFDVQDRSYLEDHFNFYGMPVILSQLRLPGYQYSYPFVKCSLKAEVDRKEINVAEELISQNLAWRPSQKLPQDQKVEDVEVKNRRTGGQQKKSTEEKEEEEWIPTQITHTLPGNMFCMIVGYEKLNLAKRVSHVLNANYKSRKLVHWERRTSEAVAIMGRCGPKFIAERAVVLSVVNKKVTAFLLDVGDVCVFPVAMVYCLPWELQLTKIPPLLTVGFLQGVLPKPTDPTAIELAAAALTELSRYNMFATNVIVHDTRIFDADVLPFLIASPDSELSCQCLRLCTNLLIRKRVRLDANWQNILFVTLGVLHTCVQRAILEKAASSGKQISPKFQKMALSQHFPKVSPPAPQKQSLHSSGDGGRNMRTSPNRAGMTANESPSGSASNEEESGVSKARNKTLIASCLMFLVNRLYLDKLAKDMFFSLKGLELVIQAMVLFRKNTYIRTAALQALCNFVHVNKLQRSEEVVLSNSSSTSSLLELSGGQALSTPDAPSSQAAAAASSSSLSSSSSSKSANPGRLRGSRLLYLLNKKIQPQPVMGVSYEEHSDDEDYSEDENDDEDLAADCVKALDPQADQLPDDTGKPYVYGEHVNFVPDSTHELCEDADLSAKSVACIISGMLNAGKEATIYLGIAEDSKVKGVQLTHNAKDELRLGLDQIMTSRISPTVLHSQYSIDFVQVYEVKEEEFVKHSELFIVEIKCRPIDRVFYCLNNGQCFYRYRNKTVDIKAQEIRHLVVVDEESWHRDEIVLLQQELQALRFDAQQKGLTLE